MPRGYDESSYNRRDPPPVRRDPRGEDRHAPRGTVEVRDRRIIEEPRDRDRERDRDRDRDIPRGSGRVPEPMEIVDSRMPPSRVVQDSRVANAGVRMERPDRHGPAVIDPRVPPREQQTYYEDPRTGRMVDPRGADPYARETTGRASNPREDPRRMDTDMDMDPPRRPPGREIVDSRDHYMEDSHNKHYNDYFVPGAGL